MTVITLNELKTQEEIINYLKDENLIPKNYDKITLESTYFIEQKIGTYDLMINLELDGQINQEFKYIINYINNEKVNIENNSGPMILTSVILLISIVIYLSIISIKKLIIKRKNNNKDSLKQ